MSAAVFFLFIYDPFVLFVFPRDSEEAVNEQQHFSIIIFHILGFLFAPN